MASHTISVTLRQRTMPSGNIRLSLDIYCKGERRLESTGLYLLPGKSRDIKRKNEETLATARLIASRKEDELRNSELGLQPKRTGNISFFKYFEECAKKRNGTTRSSWFTCLNFIRKFEDNERLSLSSIDEHWVSDFKYWLLNDAETFTNCRRDNNSPRKISQNTASNIFSKLVACLNEAVKDKLIIVSPVVSVGSIPIEETERAYLTKDELKRLAETPCPNEESKRAFLFACMTGLRFSDIAKLTWDKVSDNGTHKRIIFRQTKTKGQEYMDINSSASKLIGEKPDDVSLESLIFNRLGNLGNVNRYVAIWCKRANITKHISFHCSRHTFATLMLENGIDLYTTSKLLGHRKMQTTQIYAKIVDHKKQEAVDTIDDIL